MGFSEVSVLLLQVDLNVHCEWIVFVTQYVYASSSCHGNYDVKRTISIKQSWVLQK